MIENSGPAPSSDSMPSYPYQGAAGRAFQSFRRWLKNESFHQRGEYCGDDACRTCAAWREIQRVRRNRDAMNHPIQGSGVRPHFARPGCDYILEGMGKCAMIADEQVAVWPSKRFRNYCSPHARELSSQAAFQGAGLRRGRELAADALAALSQEHAPFPMFRQSQTEEAEMRYRLAMRRGFLAVIRWNQHLWEDATDDNRWWCLNHREYHPRPMTACCGPENQQEPPPCRSVCPGRKGGPRRRLHSFTINPGGAGNTYVVDNCTDCGAKRQAT